jgi:hypothetical protein
VGSGPGPAARRPSGRLAQGRGAFFFLGVGTCGGGRRPPAQCSSWAAGGCGLCLGERAAAAAAGAPHGATPRRRTGVVPSQGSGGPTLGTSPTMRSGRARAVRRAGLDTVRRTRSDRRSPGWEGRGYKGYRARRAPARPRGRTGGACDGRAAARRRALGPGHAGRRRRCRATGGGDGGLQGVQCAPSGGAGRGQRLRPPRAAPGGRGRGGVWGWGWPEGVQGAGLFSRFLRVPRRPRGAAGARAPACGGGRGQSGGVGVGPWWGGQEGVGAGEGGREGGREGEWEGGREGGREGFHHRGRRGPRACGRGGAPPAGRVPCGGDGGRCADGRRDQRGPARGAARRRRSACAQRKRLCSTPERSMPSLASLA